MSSLSNFFKIINISTRACNFILLNILLNSASQISRNPIGEPPGALLKRARSSPVERINPNGRLTGPAWASLINDSGV